MKLARLIAACVLLAIAICGVPSILSVQDEVTIDTPDDAMRLVTDDVHRIMRQASDIDRALWAQVWAKVAVTASGDSNDVEVIFTDTRALRAFQIIALNIAWKRLAGNQTGKYAGLGEACEKAFNDTFGGKEVQPVTPAIRAKFVALANALAWCGINKG